MAGEGILHSVSNSTSDDHNCNTVSNHAHVDFSSPHILSLKHWQNTLKSFWLLNILLPLTGMCTPLCICCVLKMAIFVDLICWSEKLKTRKTQLSFHCYYHCQTTIQWILSGIKLFKTQSWAQAISRLSWRNVRIAYTHPCYVASNFGFPPPALCLWRLFGFLTLWGQHLDRLFSTLQHLCVCVWGVEGGLWVLVVMLMSSP